MRNDRILAAALGSLFCLSGCAVRSEAEDRDALMQSLRGLIDAYRSRDLDRILSRYLPDSRLIVFDVVAPRQYVGVEGYRKSWAALLEAFPGPPKAELIDPYVEVGGDMGYSRALVHYLVTDKDGKPQMDLTARLSDVYRRIGGRWLVVHEHASWPVEFPSGKADMQSKP
jgi:ketosteroid isomerase-like protein